MSLIPLGFWAASGGGAGGAAFDLLETVSLTSSASSVTFSGLDAYSDYKHLQLRLVTRSTRASSADTGFLRFNSDSGSNYSFHNLIGNGSSVSSGNAASVTSIYYSAVPAANQAAYIFGAGIIDILDFSDANKNTTVRILEGYESSLDTIRLTSGAWYNTSAITTISITGASGNWDVGSRFSLMGVR